MLAVEIYNLLAQSRLCIELKVKNDQHKQENKKEKQLNQNNRQHEYLWGKLCQKVIISFDLIKGWGGKKQCNGHNELRRFEKAWSMVSHGSLLKLQEFCL